MQITVKSILKHLLIPIGFGIFIGNLLTLLFDWQHIFSWNTFFEQSLYSSILSLLFWKGNEVIIRYLNKRNSWLKHIKRIIITHFAIGFTYSLVIILLFYLYIWIILMHKTSLEGFYQNFKGGIYVTFTINLIVNLVVYSYFFFKYWQKSVLNEEILKRESLALQYESLKNQVNPHFLFNSLNILTSLIERDKESSITFVKQLSEVFRYVLDQNVRELVDIDTELKFVESYIYLQRIRFGENIVISIDITDHRCKVVPIALQLLIENAIKHNIISRECPLKISICDEDEFITVKNNFQKKTIMPDSTGIGLKTLSFQYEFITGKKVEIIQGEEFFTVRLPKVPANTIKNGFPGFTKN